MEKRKEGKEREERGWWGEGKIKVGGKLIVERDEHRKERRK
jgi:hypothetical protein